VKIGDWYVQYMGSPPSKSLNYIEALHGMQRLTRLMLLVDSIVVIHTPAWYCTRRMLNSRQQGKVHLHKSKRPHARVNDIVLFVFSARRNAFQGVRNRYLT
jgi:hypothetical protein